MVSGIYTIYKMVRSSFVPAQVFETTMLQASSEKSSFLTDKMKIRLIAQISQSFNHTTFLNQNNSLFQTFNKLDRVSNLQ